MKNKIKAVFFDVDDTLYDSSKQVGEARRNAIKAMIEAGLQVDEDDAADKLKKISKALGSNYPQLFDELLKEFGYGSNPRIIAAGVIAYHRTKIAYLVPFYDTIPSLLELRDRGFKLGIITDGIAVKQWEKLIRLGLQHFFHSVVISGSIGCEKPDPILFETAIKRIGCDPGECMMVGDRIDKDIKGANALNMITVQIMKGKYMALKPRDESDKPDYVVSLLSDVLKILAE